MGDGICPECGHDPEHNADVFGKSIQLTERIAAERDRLRALVEELGAALEWAKQAGRFSYSKRIPRQNEHWCNCVDALDAALTKYRAWKDRQS